MTVKMIRDLCADDLNKMVRVNSARGAVEGRLISVQATNRAPARFVIALGAQTYDLQVGEFRLAGLNDKKEVKFL